MAKLPSQRALERGIVSSQPAAELVADAMRLLPLILLRDDARVQAAYQVWWATRRAADVQPPITEAVWLGGYEECCQLFTLIGELGLARYRWLPTTLSWEFRRCEQSVLGRPTRIEVSLPSDLPSWHTAGKRPKRRASGRYGPPDGSWRTPDRVTPPTLRESGHPAFR